MSSRPQFPPPSQPGALPFWSPFLALLHSRKFLVALFAVIQTIVFVLRPDVNQDVWKAIDALAAVLIASIAHEDAAVSTRSPSSPEASRAGLPTGGRFDLPSPYWQDER